MTSLFLSLRLHLEPYNCLMLPAAVCCSLVSAGERQDEESVGGQKRLEALMMLTDMCPSYTLTIRSLCVSHASQQHDYNGFLKTLLTCADFID